MKTIRAHREGNRGQALSFADAAVKADPGDPMAQFQRGYLRGEMNDHNGAIIDLTKAIALGWKDKVLFKLRGNSLLFAGRYAAALEDAEMAVALSPDYAAAYYLRATVKLQLKRPIAEVLADLKIAAELDPAKYGAFYRKMKKDFAGMELEQKGGASAALPAPR
jgi:tetratricopeptide (TPR) repeat protein